MKANVATQRMLGLLDGTYRNENVDKLERYYEYIHSIYPKAVIAGGSIIDCVYNKPFYDIDAFIYYKDAPNPEQYVGRTGNNGMVGLIKIEHDEIDMDIVVVGKPVIEYIYQFDMDLKKAYYYNYKFYFTRASRDNIIKNCLNLRKPSSISHYFRYIKTINKYELNPTKDLDLLENYAHYLKNKNQRMRVSNKYVPNVIEFKKSKYKKHNTIKALYAEKVMTINQKEKSISI